jgi:serine/threonine protein kinase
MGDGVGRSGRVEFAHAPPDVRAWVESSLGERVVEARTQSGGFSLGLACRIRTSSGRRAFLKAVGHEPNPNTPQLFRHEIQVLSALPRVPYRASLIDSYDDGAWVGLLVDDIDGRPADFADPADRAAVRAAVRLQTRELTPDPLGLDVPGLAETVQRWGRSIARALEADPTHLPGWFVTDAPALLDRIDQLSRAMDDRTWVHLDVRPDNVLIAHDGRAVLVDWGMSRGGPWWVDEALVAVGCVTSEETDAALRELAGCEPPPGSAPVDRQDLVTFVAALAASLASLRDQPVPGLPAIDRFRRIESARLLDLAQHLLASG